MADLGVSEVIMIAATAMSAAAANSGARAQAIMRAQQATAQRIAAQQQAINAGQEMAAAERAAAEERRRGRLMQSRAQAIAAASGDAGSPTVVNIISDLAGETQYRSAMALYQGEERARMTRAGMNASLFEASNLSASSKALQQAGYIKSVGTLFEGAASMYGKYGLPSTNTSGMPSGLEYQVGQGPGGSG